MHIIKITQLILGIVFTTLLLSDEAPALLIGTSEHKGGIGSLTDPAQNITSFDITPFFTESSPFTGGYTPLGTIRIDPGTVGSQFFTDRNDPYFADTVSLLTNNYDNFIGYEAVFNYAAVPDPIYAHSIRGAGHESLILTGNGFNGTDFFGSTIDTITLSVDSFTTKPIGGTGIFTEYSYSLTYEQAVIPEPSTIFLLGSGLLGIGIFRKKHNKK